MQPKHRPVVPKEFAGLWIAWNGNHTHIVASGTTMQAALDAARAAGEADPILAKAPKPGVIFIGGYRG